MKTSIDLHQEGKFWRQIRPTRIRVTKNNLLVSSRDSQCFIEICSANLKKKLNSVVYASSRIVPNNILSFCSQGTYTWTPGVLHPTLLCACTFIYTHRWVSVYVCLKCFSQGFGASIFNSLTMAKNLQITLLLHLYLK